MKELFLVLLFFLTAGAVAPQYDVILVRSDLPLDWVIAQAYTHNSGVPIIATKPDHLDEDVKEQLSGYLRSGFNNLVIIGGEQAISPGIKSKLDGMGFLTHRISEGDRYGTSARVAIELFGQIEGAVLVNGEAYEGLLMAERVAASISGPILFVKEDEITPSVESALVNLGVKKIYIIEGTSGEIMDALLPKGYKVEVVESEWIEAGSPYNSLYIAFVLGLLLGAALALIGLRFKRYRARVPMTILTKDEEKIVKVILEHGGVLTQDKLPEKTDLSRPKISRIIMDLAGRGIVSKKPHGKTQKLTIKRDFYEEKRTL
ncbi:MAG: hypothetical protein QF673_01575 [Candidatus Hydrothermarchaeota archaeon]|jgi:hypothetical protein|nr:hypothetical protein [Candidatus Hydrothermarchaeota archaeon]